MLCRNCHTEYEGNFCPRCGALNQPTIPENNAQPQNSQNVQNASAYQPLQTMPSQLPAAWQQPQKTGRSLGTIILLSVLTLLTTVNLIFSAMNLFRSNSQSPEEQLKASQELTKYRMKFGEDITITGVEMERSEYGSYTDITGYAQNDSDQALENIAIVFRLYSDGETVETATDYIDYLPAGAKLPFSAMTTSSFDDYELFYITATPSLIEE